jgi:glutathione synthase/RimK-type ligase-like ATP-grasp enzyme
MPNKKILIYFTKKEVAADPFANVPDRREIYWSLFREGRSRGLDMYLGVKPTIHHGGMEFENVLFFTGEQFELQLKKISFDAIFDRSPNKNFPTPDIDSKTLNTLAFKKLANNKDCTYELLSEYMPKTFILGSEQDLEAALTFFRPKELAVFKPVDEFGGRGVVITEAENITPFYLISNKKFILQKFVDTSYGVPGIISGHHDLRIIIMNGTPIMLQAREPKLGELRANISQGGHSFEFSFEAAPSALRKIVSKVHPLIDTLYSYPFYSIDFGIDQDGTPYIFEINDQIGLKGAITGENRRSFCKNFIDSLEKRAFL